jgi:histidine ammonia-lyase
MQRHIDIYRHKVIMGIHNRIRKDKMGDEYEVRDSTLGAEMESANLSSQDLEINQEIPIDDPTQVVLHKEMFQDITTATRDISISYDFLDFQFTEMGRISEQKPLVMNNKYPFPIEVNWNLLNVMNRTTGQWVKNPFRVRPDK